MIRRAPADPAPYRQAGAMPGPLQPAAMLHHPARRAACEFRLKTADPVSACELSQAAQRAAVARALGRGRAGASRRCGRLLLLGKDSLPDIAGALGMHRRTLERHLQQEGTSFDASGTRFALPSPGICWRSPILPIGRDCARRSPMDRTAASCMPSAAGPRQRRRSGARTVWRRAGPHHERRRSKRAAGNRAAPQVLIPAPACVLPDRMTKSVAA